MASILVQNIGHFNEIETSNLSHGLNFCQKVSSVISLVLVYFVISFLHEKYTDKTRVMQLSHASEMRILHMAKL